MTDQGSTRASVSIAWRLVDLRVWMFLAEPRRCQAEVTELARPAAAPPTADAPVENPLPDEYPLRDGGAPVPPAGAEVGDVEVEEAEVGEAE
jgi:hypothetical protein